MKLLSRTRSILLALILSPLTVSAVPITDTVIVGNKEWAQVNLFTNLSWNSMDAVCSGGSCGTGMLNGWDMEGWNWASISDVANLLQAYTPLPALSASGEAAFGEVESTWAPAFFNATGFNPTRMVGTLTELLGFSSTRSNGSGLPLAGRVRDWDSTSISDEVRTQSFGFDEFDTMGGFFYREAAVPEPTSLALIGLGLAGFGYSRKRKAS